MEKNQTLRCAAQRTHYWHKPVFKVKLKIFLAKIKLFGLKYEEIDLGKKTYGHGSKKIALDGIQTRELVIWRGESKSSRLIGIKNFCCEKHYDPGFWKSKSNDYFFYSGSNILIFKMSWTFGLHFAGLWFQKL